MAHDDNISEKILEGISESFSVKDGRGYQKKKDLFPSLSDPIYKLKKIAENGDRRKLLEKMNINLVKDFLWFYNKDADSLREACQNIPDHDWNIIVGHALNCKEGPECYSYRIPGTDTTIFFSSRYQIVGAEFSGKYASYEELNHTQKDIVQGSKAIAYDNLKHEVITGESPRPRQPRPRQRWVNVVTMVTTLHFWNKKPERPSPQGRLDFEITDATSMDKFWAELTANGPVPLAPTTSFEMTDIMNLLVVPE